MIFYQGRTAIVTHKVFETRGQQPQIFRVSDLTGVHIVQGKNGPQRGPWLIRHRELTYELFATYLGELVRLFGTTDPVIFGQVCRGLQRALEWNEDH